MVMKNTIFNYIQHQIFPSSLDVKLLDTYQSVNFCYWVSAFLILLFSLFSSAWKAINRGFNLSSALVHRTNFFLKHYFINFMKAKNCYFWAKQMGFEISKCMIDNFFIFLLTQLAQFETNFKFSTNNIWLLAGWLVVN